MIKSNIKKVCIVVSSLGGGGAERSSALLSEMLDELGFEVITPQFLDEKNGKFKIISFYAKKARGLMTAWIIKNKVMNSTELHRFDSEGYVFDSERSSVNKPVFIRSEK